MRRHRRLVVTAIAGLVIGIMSVVGLALKYAAFLSEHNAALEAEVSRADQHAENARRLLRLADRHAYASTLRLAAQAVQSRRYETAQDLLEANQDSSDGEDLREFAWRYLHRLSRCELIRLPARDGGLHGLSMSQDGRTIASFHMDSSMVIWDLPSERPRITIAEPGYSYWNSTLTSDSRLLVARRFSRTQDKAIELGIWDANTGLIRAIRRTAQFLTGAPGEREGAIHLLDADRSVAHVATDTTGRTAVRIWALDFDNANERPRVEIDGVDEVAFAPIGLLFAARVGRDLRLHDVKTGALVGERPGEFTGDGVLALSPDGCLLATASRKKGILVRDVASLNDRSHFDVDARFLSLTFDPTGQILAAVDEFGNVHVCDRSSGRIQVVIPDKQDHPRELVRLGFSHDGCLMATTSRTKPGGDQPLVLWDTKSGRQLAVMPSSAGSYYPMFSPDGRSIIGGLRRAPRIWIFNPRPEPPSPVGHKAEAWSAAYSHDSKILATGSDDTNERQTIKLWAPATGRLVRGWNGGEGTVAALAFSPDGRTLASGHLVDENNVRLWDVATGNLVSTLRGHQDRIRSVAYAPGGQTLATAGGYKLKGVVDRTIRLWDVATVKCIRELKGHSDAVCSLAFSPDGRILATCGNDQTVRLWETDTGIALKIERSPDKLVRLAFAPDGATLAVASDGGVVTIHDPTSLAVIRTIRYEDSEQLRNLAFAPDGRSLATCGMSKVIRLSDPLTGQELLTLQGHNAQVNGIAFAPDGSSLASCSHDGAVKFWRARLPN
jgi:WD40 repeat protein